MLKFFLKFLKEYSQFFDFIKYYLTYSYFIKI